ncbi:hypothetical protein P7K49_018331 [Saguinus oedipus]|uniref:Uncharacterized protein n=1 Tax=Saguinus oedipus TaxID=9490 RepID=A0ABQ9V623_SAGOE|nr:hypothetical protein P7K49_018331 [Saguinus oedipus]
MCGQWEGTQRGPKLLAITLGSRVQSPKVFPAHLCTFLSTAMGLVCWEWLVRGGRRAERPHTTSEASHVLWERGRGGEMGVHTTQARKSGSVDSLGPLSCHTRQSESLHSDQEKRNELCIPALNI